MSTRLPNTQFIKTARIEHGLRAQTKGVVIHTIEGPASSAINFFRGDSPQGVGAHVVVGLLKTTQLADLDQVCYHAVGANSAYIGIEHNGAASYTKARWLASSPTMLRMSANRTAWICWHYKLGLPVKGKNVLAHADFPAGGHHDPGPGWPWAFYIWLAQRAYKRLLLKGKWS